MEWEERKLSEICSQIFAGGDVPKSNLSKFKTEKYSVPIYANGEKNKGLYGYTDIEKVTTPSMTVSARGTIGYSEIRWEPFYPVVRLIVLTPDLEIVGLEFLKYILASIDFKNSGSSIPQLTVPMIKGYTCSLPSLDEQTRIITILDQTFADLEQARIKTEQNLKSARELFDSYLQKVFSQLPEHGNQKTLGQISTRVSVGHVGSTSKFYCDSDVGVPFLRSQNVRPYGIKIEGVKHITWKFHKSLKKSTLESGDLLFVRVGANRGDCCALRDFEGELNCANIVFARPRGHSIDYLEHFCNSTIGQEELLGMSTGSAQGVINTKSVAQLRIPLPPPEVQLNLVRKINQVKKETERLEATYRSKIIALNELKKAILQKAFSGELTKDNKGVVALANATLLY